MTEEVIGTEIQQNVVEEYGNKDEITTKHPLQNEWEFWYFKPNKGSKNIWQDNLLRIHSFNTVEDFWALYNHIELPSRLQPGSDYNLFKSGVAPMWESEGNKNGGRLVILFKKSTSNKPNASSHSNYDMNLKMTEDKIWLETCLCLIGETFGPESDKICGLVFNARPKLDRISIWTSDWKDEEGIVKIGNILKERTNFNDKLVYEKHGDNNKSTLYSI